MGSYAAQKTAYDRDGLLKLSGFFTDQLSAINEELAEYSSHTVPTLPPNDVVYEKDGTAIRNLWRMERYSPFFAELQSQPALIELVETLVNGPARSLGVELFAKPAQVGSAVPFHQDNAYFNLTPPDSLTCWIAIDASTQANGCVHYLVGSHLHGVDAHKPSHVKGNSMMLADTDAASQYEELPGVLEAGDAMIHHCNLWHRSEPNRSDRSRRGLLIVYQAEHCRKDLAAESRYKEALSLVSST